MQLIDALIYGTTVMAFGYVVTMFVLSVTARKVDSRVEQGEVLAWLEELAEEAEGEFSCDADPIDAAVVDGYMQAMAAPVLADNVVPFIRPAPKHPALEDLSIRDLKKLASAAKIRGYSNLRQAELIERLRAVRRAA